jgi:hypothetical protein
MNQDDETLIIQAVEGLLEGTDWEAFQQRVVAEPAFRQSYAEELRLHSELHSMGSDLPETLALPMENRPRWMLAAFCSAAAALVTVLLSWLFFQNNNGIGEGGVATITSAEGCRWAGSDLPTVEGARLGIGHLNLIEGMATLTFDSGAEIAMEAPANLEVLDAMRCRLVKGSIVADVPESAHGFTVDAPNLEVVDLGTRFGITANQFGIAHVMVFEGEVEVQKSGETKVHSLTTGKTLVSGVSQIQAPSGDEFPAANTPLDPAPPGWQRITTRDGEGKDSFVRKTHPKPQGNSPLMMVKETELSELNRRKAIVSFDLSTIENRAAITGVELRLDVEPSGLGFASLIPDSRFAIYACHQDDWPEATLLWDSFPAIDPATRLASFDLRRGISASASVKVSSPDLLTFIREDKNHLSTLLVVRETGEFDKQGLVHAFATREHPDAFPPTLMIRTTLQP